MRKTKTGIVISNKMDKTAIVRVDRMVPHPKYGKRFRVSKNFAAHDADNSANIGDIVIIEEGRPMSRTKSWVIIERKATVESADAAKVVKAAKPTTTAKKTTAKKATAKKTTKSTAKKGSK